MKLVLLSLPFLLKIFTECANIIGINAQVITYKFFYFKKMLQKASPEEDLMREVFVELLAGFGGNERSNFVKQDKLTQDFLSYARALYDFWVKDPLGYLSLIKNSI